MGLESVTRIADLVATNPIGASDPKSQGDDHIRALKVALRSLLNAVPGAAAAKAYTISGGMITPDVSGVIYLKPESGTEDDLTHVVPTNCPEGSVIVLRNDPDHPTYTITIKDQTTGSGRLRPRGGYSFPLRGVDYAIVFQYLGGIWREIVRGGDYQHAVDRISSIDRTVGLTEYAFQLPGGDYLHFECELRALSVAADAEPRISFSQDGGSTWLTGSSDYSNLRTRVGGGSTSSGNDSTNSGRFMAAGNWASATFLNGTVKVYHAGPAFAVADLQVRHADTFLHRWTSRVDLSANDNGINAIRIYAGGVAFTNGAVTLYGWI